MPVQPILNADSPPVPSGDAAPVDQSNPAPVQPSNPPARPDGLPDSFWDEKIGVRTPELVAEFNAMAAERDRLAATFKDFPEKPEDAGKFYKLPEELLPEGMTLPDGVTFEPNNDLLTAALPVLHKHRIPAEAFQELTRAFNGYELARYEKAATDFAEDGKKLGAEGATRRKAVADGLAALVGPEMAGFIDPAAITSGGIQFFEAILAKVAGSGNVVPLNGKAQTEPPPPPTLTLADRMYGQQQKAS